MNSHSPAHTEVNWGSSTQAQTYTLALNSVASLGHVEEHVKTYRPQILVLCGAPSARPPLLHFANSITKNMSLLIAGHCLKVIRFIGVASFRCFIARRYCRCSGVDVLGGKSTLL